jgi:PAS domain S-box-containing protein
VAGWVFALAVVAAFPAVAYATCKSPLPSEALRALDAMADGDPLAAVAEANRRLGVASPNDPITLAQLYAIIADAQDTIDNDPAARDAVARARVQLDRAPPDPAVGQLRLRLALIEADGLQTPDALAAGVQTLKELERGLGARSLERACLLLSRSRIEGRLTHQDVAAEAAVTAYRIASDLGAPNVASDAAYELATTYRRAGLFSDALRMADEAIDYTRSAGHRAGLANALWEKARILGDAGQYAAALIVLSESAQLTNVLHDVTGTAFDDLERCNELLGLQRVDEAEQACLAADRQFHSLGRDDQHLITEYYLVRIDIARGRFAQALRELDPALAGGGQRVPPRILAGLYGERADVLSHLARPGDALRDLRQSMQIDARENQLQRSLGATALSAQLQIERIDHDKQELERTVRLEREVGARRALTTRLSIGIAVASLALSAALVALLWSRTRHQRAMRRAAESLETHARVIDTVREGVLLVDDNRRIEYANPALLRLLGRDGNDVRGKALDAIGLSAADLGDPAAAERGSMPADGHEVHLSSPGGDELILLLTRSTLELGTRSVHIHVLQDVTERRRLEREVLEIAGAERDRLSHDVHDGLGQELTGIALLLKSLVSGATTDRGTLEAIIGHVNQAIVNARTLAHSLAPVHLAGGALDVALALLAAHLSQTWPIRVTCAANLGGLRLAGSDADHLYRIAQEGITNAMRHSDCKAVAVELRVVEDNLSLSISDDGVGFRPGGALDGLGLRTIAYRARLLRGTLHIEHPATGGARIVVLAPLRHLAQ